MGLLEELPETERSNFVRVIVSQGKNLYIGEEILRTLAHEAGLWDQGRSYALGERPASEKWKNVIPIEIIPEFENLWLGQVRLAAAEDRLHQQPHLGYILHRWGQFASNDYSEPREYVGRFCERSDPLLLLQHFAMSTGLDGLDKFITNPAQVKIKLATYNSNDELRKLAIETMSNLERLQQNRSVDVQRPS